VIPEVVDFKEEGLVSPERRVKRRKMKVENLLVQGEIAPGSPT
jgi:hypothetical protein